MKFITTCVLLIGSLTAHAARPIPTTPEELTKTVQAAFANADAEIEVIIAIPNNERTFENTIGAIDSMMARLDEGANMSLFMGYVHPDAAIREAATAGEQYWSEWAVDFATNEALYSAVRAYADTNPILEGEQARLLLSLIHI